LQINSKEDILPGMPFQVIENNLEQIKEEFAKEISEEIIVDDDIEVSLADAKTTYNLDLEYISWQLSMYELAKGKQFKKLYAIWLPKRKPAQLVEVERKSKEEIQWLIKKYKEIKLWKLSH